MSKQKTSWQDTVSDWLGSIIVAVALAFCIRTFIVEPYMVEGSSMYPTLVNHERLLVNKFTYFVSDPQKGEIIVFRYPKDESRDFIKRVIATAGDTVEMRSGKVLVNGTEIDEPYTWKEDPKGRTFLITENPLCRKGIFLYWAITETTLRTAVLPM